MPEMWKKTKRLSKLQNVLKFKTMLDTNREREAKVRQTISDDSKLWYLEPSSRLSFSKLSRSASEPNLTHEEVNMFYKMRQKQPGSFQLLVKPNKDRVLKTWKTVKNEIHTIVKAPHLFPTGATIWNTLDVKLFTFHLI